MRARVQMLPQNGHLECLKYLREEVKAPWDSGYCHLGGCKVVIFIYSNILLSVSMINITTSVYVGGRERPLRLFEVLARNRQSALDSDAVRYAHKNNHTECVQYLLDNNCPLPPGWRYEDGVLHTS